jgi:hypothetical protein
MIEASMRPMAIVVISELRYHLLQMPLVEDEHMIQAFSSQRAYEPLGNGIRLRCSDRRANLADAEAFCPARERLSENRIPVSNQEAGRRTIEAGIDDLLPGPGGGRMPRYPYMYNLSWRDGSERIRGVFGR